MTKTQIRIPWMSVSESGPTGRSVVLLVSLVVVLASLFLRIHQLDRLPGVNGDEAFAPVHLAEMMAGNPHSLRTSLGTPFNPFHAGTVVVVNALTKPSFIALRMPGLIYGLLSMLVAFGLLRNVLSEGAALSSALLITALPLHIAYARISNEPSLVPLASLVCLYFALRGDKLKTALALLASIWIYPPCLFLLPMLAAPFVPGLVGRIRERRIALPLMDVAIVLTALGVSYLVVPDTRYEVVEELMGPGLGRASDLDDASRFAHLFANLLSGATVYKRLTGQLSAQSLGWHVGLFWLIALPVLIFGLWRMIKLRASRDLLLIAGFAASIIAYYLLTGSTHLVPGRERHAAMFTAPACVLFSICLDRALSEVPMPSAAPLVAAGLSLVLLASLHNHLFLTLQTDPSRAHHAYQTGPQEPKALALDTILFLRDPQRPTHVRVQDWWLYWPIRYLAQNHEGVHVSMFRKPQRDLFPADYWQPLGPPGEAETYALVYPGGRLHRRLTTRDRYQEIQEIRGFGDHPVLVLLKDAGS